MKVHIIPTIAERIADLKKFAKENNIRLDAIYRRAVPDRVTSIRQQIFSKSLSHERMILLEESALELAKEKMDENQTEK